MNSERWSSIPGYEGYLISSLGRVMNKNNGRLRKVQVDGRGYKCVDFFVKGVRKRGYIGNLVAHAFLDNPEQGERATFIDGDPNNVSLQNLKWVRELEEYEEIYHRREVPTNCSCDQSEEKCPYCY